MRAVVGLMLCVQISEADIPNGECDDISLHPRVYILGASGTTPASPSRMKVKEPRAGCACAVAVVARCCYSAANAEDAPVRGRARLLRGNGERCMLNAP
jgi:hypothetical protein